MKVFDNVVADGASAAFPNHEGKGNLYVSGNLGGGTITVEAKAPGEATWVPVEGVSITAAGMFVIDTAPAVFRLSLAGATTPAVNAWFESASSSVASRIVRES